MKLKKVAAICGQVGIFQLFDQVDENGEFTCQWPGDCGAFYPIVGMPYMGAENICAMFDIPEKKREKLIFRHDPAPVSFNWDDTDPKEWKIDDPKLCVRWEGREMLPLRTSAGITFIQEKYLSPLDGLDYMQLYERKSTSGGLYIVAKIGMILQAIIMPMDLPDRDFMDALNDLTHKCRDAMRIRALAPKQDNAMEREPGPLFQVDKGTGEIIGEGAGE